MFQVPYATIRKGKRNVEYAKGLESRTVSLPRYTKKTLTLVAVARCLLIFACGTQAGRIPSYSRYPCKLGDTGYRCNSYWNYLAICLSDSTTSEDIQNIQNFLSSIYRDCRADSQIFFKLFTYDFMNGTSCGSNGCNDTVLDAQLYRPCNLTATDLLAIFTDARIYTHVDNEVEGVSLFIITNLVGNAYANASNVSFSEHESLAKLLDAYGVSGGYFVIGNRSDATYWENETFVFRSYASTSQLPSPSLFKTCYIGSNGRNGKLVWVVPIVVLGLMLMVTLLSLFVYQRRRRTRRPKLLSSALESFARTNTVATMYPSLYSVSPPRDGIEKDGWEVGPRELLVFEDEKLGSGAYASVYKGEILEKPKAFYTQRGNSLFAQNTKDSEMQVAVKMLPPHADQRNREDFLREMNLMKTIGYHPHIVNLVGCITNRDDPYLILEYCQHGDLLTYLQNSTVTYDQLKCDDPQNKSETRLAEKDLVSFAWQVSSGMEYLASKDLIHRDLAARNVLLTTTLTAKVSDFGLCRRIDDGSISVKERLPVKWMAPESIKKSAFSSKSDVWSYGVLLYEVFSIGGLPYKNLKPQEVLAFLEEGQRLEKPDKSTDQIYDLMKNCWTLKPEERPSFFEIKDFLGNYMEMHTENYKYLPLVDG